MNAAEQVNRFVRVKLGADTSSPVAFCMLVPACCESRPPELTAVPVPPFAPLAQFLAPRQVGLEISVAVTLLTVEVESGDFLVGAARSAGRTILQRKDLEHGIAELFEEYEARGKRWVARVRGVKAGQLLFRVEAASPRDTFSAVAEACNVSVTSFELTGPPPAASAETLCECRCEGAIPFTFDYPGSWRLHREFPVLETRACLLENVFEHHQEGSILVYALPKPAVLAHALNPFRAWLKSASVQLNGAPLLPQQPTSGFSGSHVYYPVAQQRGVKISTGARILESADGSAVAVLGILSPDRETAEWSWAVNRRALNIVSNTLAFRHNLS